MTAPDAQQGRELEAAESTLTVEVVAAMWRCHTACNWVSDGHNVRWSCGIIHPGPIHMQPTTRDRHFAALMVTQVEAERALAVKDAFGKMLQKLRERDAAKAATAAGDPA